MDRRACLRQNVAGWDRAARLALVAALFVGTPFIARHPYWLLATGLVAGLLLETAVDGY